MISKGGWFLSAAFQEKVIGLQLRRPVNFVAGSMVLVGAGSHDNIDAAAAGMALLGIETGGLHFELLEGLGGGLERHAEAAHGAAAGGPDGRIGSTVQGELDAS